MDDKLPESVDVIVLGTGLPEAILASACARSGLSVLHLDRNEYYGGEWSSFTMTTIGDFFDMSKSELSPLNESSFGRMINDGEKLVELGNRKIFENVQSEWIKYDSEEGEEESTEEKLKKVFRRFSIDLLPKVLLSRGAMVQTLCDSQVSQYAEFKLVDRQLCPSNKENGTVAMNRVPCSKGEIFTSPVLTVMEKRALMKFITFCTQLRNKTEEETKKVLAQFVDQPFSTFLKSMGIGETLQSFIINTIGILEPRPNTFDGMSASCQFMDSVGHFGPSPFLFPLYGCGELSQCFCRLAAVFGSLYCLGRPVQALIYGDDGKIVAVIADNQRVNCSHVIMSGRYVPEKYRSDSSTGEENVERVVYVTDKSLMVEEKEHISLINAAPLRPDAKISRIIEAGFEACTAPKNYFLVHATGTADAPESIGSVTERLFKQNEIKPAWMMSFSINCLRFEDSQLPDNLIVSPNIDASIHYSKVIENCKNIFTKVWPDRDFLPRSIKTEEKEEDEENVEETNTSS